MIQIGDFFSQLFKSNSWPARWHCGQWTDFHGWLYICSDLAIWAAYFAIPILLISFLRRKSNFPIPSVIWLFGVFILFCGLTHLMDALIFWWPAYRLSALLRFLTAIVSWMTIVAIFKFVPIALALKTSKDFEKELSERKKSESKFRGLLESAPDAIVITGHDGKIQMINAQTERLFGYSRDEIEGKEVEILIPQRFHQKHTHHRQGYVDDPKVRAMGSGMDLFGIKKDGQEFPLEISLSPLKIEKEDILIISAIRDITRQKQIETEIKKLNGNLEQLVIERTQELELALKKEQTLLAEMNQNQIKLTFLTDASEILASSLNYSQILANLAKMITPKIADWCSIDEVSSEGSIKRIVVSHVDPKKIKLAYDLEQKYPSDPSSPNGVHEVIRTQQPKLFHLIPEELIVASARNQEHLQLMLDLGLKSAIIMPLLNRDSIYGVLTLILAESGRLFDEKDIAFVNEIAKRTTLAIENAKLYSQLQDNNAELEVRVANRTFELEAMNRELEAFCYSVSHDLRAPLRSIDGFSNKILKDYGSLFDEKGTDYFMRVKNASQHMGQLIDDLLKLSRLSRIEMFREITNLTTIANTIATELKETDPERKASFEFQQGIMANVDTNLIQIILQNLLGNAWKYSRNKAETKIEFGTFQRDNQTVYFIRDNGVGFDMKYVSKLFGAFQRLHSVTEFEGNGIGLATVQRIIHRHQGEVWADSQVDNGTTFYFTLQAK